MNFSKDYINDLGKKTSFNENNIEKVIRLLDILEFIFAKSSFKDALVLKGGTAINLIHTNMKRLSVDIDLDYHRHLEKELAQEDRKLILEELDEYMKKDGYKTSNKSRESVILSSKIYSYVNASGNLDNIKIEINFIDRISLYETSTYAADCFGKTVSIVSLSKEELYGMKLAALIDRSKPRDLYDINYLFENFKDIDTEKLKKAAIFYMSLDSIFETGESLYLKIDSMDKNSIKRELFPVIKRGETFNLTTIREKIRHELKTLLSFDKKEIRYLKEFSNGNYKPELLFETNIKNRAINHPMAKWKILLKQKQNPK